MQQPEGEITFACQECGRRISFPGERCGRTEICPECGAYVDVPDTTEKSLPAESLAAASAPVSPASNDRAKSAIGNMRTSRQLRLEVLAVLCLGYFPFLYGGIAGYFTRNDPPPSNYSWSNGAAYLILGSLQVIMPLLVILALSEGSWSAFGIGRPRWFMDAVAGGIIWLCVTLGYRFTRVVLLTWQAEPFGTPLAASRALPNGVLAYGLWLASILVAAFAEELVMRGYLIPRLERLLRSTWVAIAVTSVLYASYHIYQGMNATIGHAVAGVVYAVSFCLLRRLWPLWLAHVLHNFLVTV